MNDEIVITAEVDEVTIEPKNGKVIDLENSDLSVGKIVFKKKENELPTKWENFREDLRLTESYGYFPTDEEKEAMYALRKLCWLRDAYNGEPLADWCNWTNSNQKKYCIVIYKGEIYKDDCVNISKILSFKTEKLRDKFLKNFEDLILTAKPLL